MRNVLTVLAVVVAGLGSVNFFTETIPLYISHPLGMLALGYLIVGRILPARILRPADPPPPLTGRPLASARCSGAIGTVRVQQMMRVTAYADRLVVGVTLVGSRTIMADQLTRLSVRGTLWQTIRIEHTAAGLVSPVTLQLRAAHPLRQAVTWLAGSR
jgi:hypothetical protein